MNTLVAESELVDPSEKTVATASAGSTKQTTKVKPLRKDTQITRAKILDAAEELFARNSITGTSLLDIAKASEQKNRSALQYHFNNKEGLLDAVLDRHSYIIRDRRNFMLDVLEARDSFSFKEIMRALIQPMADHLDEPGGANFLKIHSDLMAHEQFRSFRERRYNLPNDMQRIRAIARQKIPPLTEEEIQVRLIMTGCILVHGFNSFLGTVPQPARELFVSTIAQSLNDLWQQPTA